MKAVADTLGVARSNLIARRAKPTRPRGPYRKPEDAALLLTIRQIVDARPTYGYRRWSGLVEPFNDLTGRFDEPRELAPEQIETLRRYFNFVLSDGRAP